MQPKPKAPKPSRKPEQEQAPREHQPLPGQPGYRTRPGRSGYDPIDSRTEGAHMLGVFIRQFFTLQLRTRRPAALFLLAVLGAGLVAPLLLAIGEAVSGSSRPLGDWIVLGALGAAGLAALANLAINLLQRRK